MRDVVKEFRIIPEEHESSVISSVPVILVYVRLEPAFCKIIPSVFQRGAVIIDHPLSDFRQKYLLVMRLRNNPVYYGRGFYRPSLATFP